MSKFKMGDRVYSEDFGYGKVVHINPGMIGVIFEKENIHLHNAFSNGLNISFAFLPNGIWGNRSIVKVENQPTQFNIGDKVMLKEKFYNYPEFKDIMNRTAKNEIARLDGIELTIEKKSILDDRIFVKESKYNIPISLLVLSNSTKNIKEPEVERICSNCKHIRLFLREEPCRTCFLTHIHSNDRPCFVKRLTVETANVKQQKHQWTDAEIGAAQRIIGEIICDSSSGKHHLTIDCSCWEEEHLISAKLNNTEAISSPSKHDEPNKTIGICVALCKVTGRPIPPFIMGR